MRTLLFALMLVSAPAFAWNNGYYGNGYYGNGYYTQPYSYNNYYNRPGYYGGGFQGYQQNQYTCLPSGCIAPPQTFTAQKCPANIQSLYCDQQPKEYWINK